MTSNQIAYQNLKETQRANITREGETARSNRAQETLKAEYQQEVARANRVNEDIKRVQNDINYLNYEVAHARTAIEQQNANTRLFEANTALKKLQNDKRDTDNRINQLSLEQDKWNVNKNLAYAQVRETDTRASLNEMREYESWRQADLNEARRYESYSNIPANLARTVSQFLPN